jgi:hypothetical protein
MTLLYFNETVELKEKDIEYKKSKTFFGNWFNENVE